MGEVLWRDGDAWCDLTARVGVTGTATVVSLSGTAVLLDVDGRPYRRVPLEGGHRLPVDFVWLALGTFALTPCGLVIDGETWYRGTHVRLVLAGLNESWLHSDVGPELLSQVMARQAPCSPGHPASPCRAQYCVSRVTGDNNLVRENS